MKGAWFDSIPPSEYFSYINLQMHPQSATYLTEMVEYRSLSFGTVGQSLGIFGSILMYLSANFVVL